MKKLLGKTTALLLVTAVILSAFAFVPVYADTAQECIIQWGYNQIDNGLEIGGTSKMRSHGGDDNNKVWELSAQAQVSDPSKCVAYIADTTKFLPVTADTRESVKMTVYYQGGYYGWQGHARPGLVGRLEGIEGNVYITTPTFYDDADLYNALIQGNGWNANKSKTYTLADFEDYGVIEAKYLEGLSAERLAELEVQDDPEWKYFKAAGQEQGNNDTFVSSGWKRVKVDWTKIYPSFALKPLGININWADAGWGIKYPISHNGGNFANVILRDVSFKKVCTPEVEIKAIDETGASVGTTESGVLTIPANASVIVETNSDYSTDFAAALSLAKADGTAVDASFEKIDGSSYKYKVNAQLEQGTGYKITAAALTDVSGNAFAGGEYAFATIAPEMILNPPTNLRANGGKTSISLAWDAPATGEYALAAEKYEIYRDGAYIGETTATSYEDAGLAAGTKYTYKVKAINGEKQAESETIDVSTEAVAPVTGLKLSFTTTESIGLTWNAVDEAIGYRVWRGSDLLGTVKSTKIYDFALTPGTTYTYTVKAVMDETTLGSAAEITAATDAGTKKPLLTMFQNGRLMLGARPLYRGNNGWIADAVKSSDDSAVTGMGLSVELYDWSRVCVSIANQDAWNSNPASGTENIIARLSGYDYDDVGMFMYVKPLDNSEYDIAFPGNETAMPYGKDESNNEGGDLGGTYANVIKWQASLSENYIPVYIPLKELAVTNRTVINGLSFYGNSSGAHKLLLDKVAVITRTPSVNKVFYTDYDGNIVDGTMPVDIAAVNVSFSTPMEASSLNGITISNGALFEGKYDEASMIYTMTLLRKLDYGKSYDVTVPATVRAKDAYGTFSDKTSSTVKMTTDTLVEGPALGAEYKTAFTTEANPLQISLSIVKDGTNAKAKAVFTNTGAAREATVIICTYEISGSVYKLSGMKTAKANIASGVSDYAVGTESVSADGASVVKAFVWNNMDDLEPLTGIVSE